MKKNIVIAILSVMVIVLVGVIICMSLKMEEDKKEKQSSNQKPENQEQINEQGTSQKEREYIRYTSTELKFDKNSSNGIGIKMEIKDGKLVETSNEGLTFSGIEGKIKYFTYDIGCGGDIGFLALTDNNKVYVAFYDYAGTYGGSDKSIVFQEIKVNGKTKDITEYVNPNVGSCASIDLGVVLENGKIYAVEGFHDGNYKIGTTDYSSYKK